MIRLTKYAVIDKFNQLHKKYYNCSGYMISTINDERSKQFLANEPTQTWLNTWNAYASKSVQIQTLHAKMEVLNQTFNIRLDRPLERDERYEFEAYFGFGGHCDGYSDNRIIMCFIHKFNKDCNVSDLLLDGGSELDLVDVDFANQSILLLLLGGYVKYWDAIYEMVEWFQGAGIPVLDSTQILSYIFDKMVIE